MRIELGDEKSLSVRAAWLHYVGGYTQAEVAKRLNIKSVKAHRLIAKANQDGVVHVSISGTMASCVELENQIARKFALDECIVAPNLNDSQSPIKEIGVAAAMYMRRLIAARSQKLIGIGHGRTLRAMVSELPNEELGDVEFVSLLGGLTRNYAANPHDVIHRLAEKTRSISFVMPVPLYANSSEDVSILISQKGVAEVLTLANDSPLKFVGIGALNDEFGMASSGIISKEELEDAQSKGAIAEILGTFVGQNGEIIETELSQRTISVDIQQCNKTDVVAVAGGDRKVAAIRSVLMGSFINCLITDEQTANSLVAH